MKIEDFVNLSLLLETYKNLLTEKEANVLDMYVNMNMSYLEIAEDLHITKTAVMYFIKSAQEKLRKYENNLKMLKIKTILANTLSIDDTTKVKYIINQILKGEL